MRDKLHNSNMIDNTQRSSNTAVIQSETLQGKIRGYIKAKLCRQNIALG